MWFSKEDITYYKNKELNWNCPEWIFRLSVMCRGRAQAVEEAASVVVLHVAGRRYSCEPGCCTPLALASLTATSALSLRANLELRGHSASCRHLQSHKKFALIAVVYTVQHKSLNTCSVF